MAEHEILRGICDPLDIGYVAVTPALDPKISSLLYGMLWKEFGDKIIHGEGGESGLEVEVRNVSASFMILGRLSDVCYLRLQEFGVEAKIIEGVRELAIGERLTDRSTGHS